ncbi:patatin-like phospholipase family protein [Agromyces endophyticus]|uniref:patatin-like phospholipase family protein n=1 Tax=Agromyces sp. H17E-10 TaxID=2932244 RepID=UPI00351D0D77
MNDNTSFLPAPSVDASDRMPASGARALVLGGGGSSGNAWLIGVLAGLADCGVDVTAPDLTIGTSAGSTTAAQLAGATPAELYAQTIEAAPPQRRPDASPAWTGTRPAPGPGAGPDGRTASRPIDHLARTGAIIATSHDADDMRRRMGASALALDASADDAQQSRWRATVASRLPSTEWPDRTLLLTAVDAETAETVLFDRDSGVELVDAVAASCAGGFAYRIDDRWYIDGGYRTNAENADLAAGHERVLVLSPFGGRTRLPLEWGLHLAAQVDELRAGGSRVETIFPTSDDAYLFENAMNVALRPAAARAGFDRGREVAELIAAFWG